MKKVYIQAETTTVRVVNSGILMVSGESRMRGGIISGGDRPLTPGQAL